MREEDAENWGGWRTKLDDGRAEQNTSKDSLTITVIVVTFPVFLLVNRLTWLQLNFLGTPSRSSKQFRNRRQRQFKNSSNPYSQKALSIFQHRLLLFDAAAWGKKDI